ncbi:hypothetical protein S40293_04917 [Stachybotrys chartarum IBT 40293]|nr:hypothetical protein S40293_04917 [Stachybotrys chartarum IBT 40293]
MAEPIAATTTDEGVEPRSPTASSDGTSSGSDSSSDVDERETPVNGQRSSSDNDTSSLFEAPALMRRQSSHVLQRRVSRGMVEDSEQFELHRIATALSRRYSTATGTLSNANATGSAMNPDNANFDLEKWLQAFVKTLHEHGVTANHMGAVYKNLDIFGTSAAIQVQDTVGTYLTTILRLGEMFSFGKKQPKQILHSVDGLIKPGELVIVLGRPGSGCSTYLKALTGELHGLSVGEKSVIHYDGIPLKQMMQEFKGEAVYNQEVLPNLARPSRIMLVLIPAQVDKHFPHLTVGQTLEFAAKVRTMSGSIRGMSHDEFCRYTAKVVMATLGLSHTYNTKVGNDFVRGVSGGERKRVSIAEMMLSGSPLSAWDNSTRGLDSATAFKFVQGLRLASDFGGQSSLVAIYQASQAIYDLFDKTVLLYEGRQVYWGPSSAAKAYFERQGWYCPPRQTTGDFLTSVTNPSERKPREGMENKVPRTSQDFEQYWRASPEYKALQEEIETYECDFLAEGNSQRIEELREKKHLRQEKHARPGSPYTVSVLTQIRLNTIRAYQRLWNDKASTFTQCLVQLIMALILGSTFYGTPNTTAGFYSKGSVLFLAVLMNALTAISEINSLYAQRPIVEKHNSYAFYHPATEAAAGIVADIPIKFLTGTVFNIVLYFMAGLRREPSQFFIFFLIAYISTFVMSAVFRTMAAATKTVSQAMSLSGVMVLALVIYTGFVISVPSMHPWFSWIRWINPIFYAFEIMVANEFHGREFACGSFVPPYSPRVGDSFICSVAGAVAGESTVSGDAFIAANYRYYYSNVWRNFGILLAFLVGFIVMYLITTEFNSNTTSTAEALVFQRGRVPAYLKEQSSSETSSSAAAKVDENPGAGDVSAIERQKDIFTWRDVVYDIRIKDEPRRLLDNVSGWVKPGTLTALMGVSGAGKTTLLDVLAQRTTMGIVTGDMFVNGKPLSPSFQRKTGYVQQQDLHLETATVRESLRFSAMLRQPESVSKQEKYAFVEEVIKMLEMEEFADAVVGVPGQGLNVQQRKLLTIGVELAAKPALLLFLDEPTSGLDSQSSWAICAFLRKLADAGQAVLCTIHQPSAILFQEFDRLLFLAKGGKTVYFGDIGPNSETLLQYFERNGARKCGDEENPAEYMLEIVNKGSNKDNQDWHSVWKGSPEGESVYAELDKLHGEKMGEEVDGFDESRPDAEFAAPFGLQLREVVYRVFQQYWRTPSYIFAKFSLGIAAGLFIGFSFFNANNTQAGMQIVLFSVFMVLTIFSTIVQQIQPFFVTQRSLYEVRERPSKAYSWKAFVIANLIVEIPYQVMTGILTYACFYYPVVGVQSSERQGLVLLFIIQLFIYASAFAHMTIAAMPDATTAASIVTLLTIMSTIFCGVLQGPDALPGFWIFMYRVSPFTYIVAGLTGTMLHARPVDCSTTETSIFDPPSGETCGSYLQPFLSAAPGRLQNPEATASCQYCTLSNADQYLSTSNIYWSERWRNFGIVWAFVVFNLAMAVLLYYTFRVKKWNKASLIPKFAKRATASKA